MEAEHAALLCCFDTRLAISCRSASQGIWTERRNSHSAKWQ